MKTNKILVNLICFWALYFIMALLGYLFYWVFSCSNHQIFSVHKSPGNTYQYCFTTSIGIHRLWLYTGITVVSYGPDPRETTTLKVLYEDRVVYYSTHLLSNCQGTNDTVLRGICLVFIYHFLHLHRSRKYELQATKNLICQPWSICQSFETNYCEKLALPTKKLRLHNWSILIIKQKMGYCSIFTQTTCPSQLRQFRPIFRFH